VRRKNVQRYVRLETRLAISGCSRHFGFTWIFLPFCLLKSRTRDLLSSVNIVVFPYWTFLDIVSICKVFVDYHRVLEYYSGRLILHLIITRPPPMFPSLKIKKNKIMKFKKKIFFGAQLKTPSNFRRVFLDSHTYGGWYCACVPKAYESETCPRSYASLPFCCRLMEE
jgi:hypothetical protein